MRLSAFAFGCALLIAVPYAWAHTQPIIFFHGGHSNELDPEQWRLGPEAYAVLKRVVGEFRHYKDRYLLIVGYDEKASPADLSYARSLKRAEATRDALIEMGLPADALAVKACGASELLVDVMGPEPQNRRVTFDFADALQNLLIGDRRVCPDVRPPNAAAR